MILSLEMTAPQRHAHERLLESLPVYSHIDKESAPPARWRRAGRSKRPVIVHGTLYESIRQASENLNVCTATIHHHLKRRHRGWRYA